MNGMELKEYLAHRLYNVITDVSLNARLVRMTYPNPDNPDRKIVNLLFSPNISSRSPTEPTPVC